MDDNILNLALLVRKDFEAEYLTVAAWLPSHDAVLRELLSSPDLRLRPGKRYSTNGKQGSIHFISDEGGRIFCAITKVEYPSRVAHMMLDDFRDKLLLSQHNSATLIASQPHEMSKSLQGILDGLIDRYDNPSDVDAMTSVQSKIDVTTSTMHDNINLLLENDAKLEQIETKADNMTDQSEKFRASSKNLKNKMWWKLCKMRICYALIAISLLAIIIVPMSLQANATAGAVDSASDTTTVVHVYGDDEYYWETHNNKHNNRFADDHRSAPEQKTVAGLTSLPAPSSLNTTEKLNGLIESAAEITGSIYGSFEKKNSTSISPLLFEN